MTSKPEHITKLWGTSNHNETSLNGDGHNITESSKTEPTSNELMRNWNHIEHVKENEFFYSQPAIKELATEKEKLDKFIQFRHNIQFNPQLQNLPSQEQFEKWHKFFQLDITEFTKSLPNPDHQAQQAELRKEIMKQGFFHSQPAIEKLTTEQERFKKYSHFKQTLEQNPEWQSLSPQEQFNKWQILDQGLQKRGIISKIFGKSSHGR